MSRWKAASIHLGISAVIALIACTILLGIWYPPPYFQAGGGWRLLMLLVGVDVVLGPLLTLIVFRHGKPRLKWDLAFIGVVQTAALLYGAHMMWQSRPVFLVASVDRFVLVAANELDPKDIAHASHTKWRTLSWTGPVLVATHRPDNKAFRQKLLFSGLAGKDIEKFPQYYVDYGSAVHKLLEQAHPLRQLQAMHPQNKKNIKNWLNRHNVSAHDVVWLPVVARDGDVSMLMNRNDGTPIGAIALDPWHADPISSTRRSAPEADDHA